MNYLMLFFDDPELTVKNSLRFIHFIGIALGLGGATMLDLTMLRFFFRGKISADTYDVVEFASKIVSFGLHILWVTGVGFLLYYAIYKVGNLSNPKIYAKLIIVMILTANGIFIHNVVLPTLKAQIGKNLFAGIGRKKRFAFIASGAISAVSWYTPVAIGAFSQLNFKVPAHLLLALYFAAIVLLCTGMYVLANMLKAGEGKFENTISKHGKSRTAHSAIKQNTSQESLRLEVLEFSHKIQRESLRQEALVLLHKIRAAREFSTEADSESMNAMSPIAADVSVGPKIKAADLSVSDHTGFARQTAFKTAKEIDTELRIPSSAIANKLTPITERRDFKNSINTPDMTGTIFKRRELDWTTIDAENAKHKNGRQRLEDELPKDRTEENIDNALASVG